MNDLLLKLKIINALAGIVLKGKNFGDFVLRKPVQIFEKNLAGYIGSKYVFGVASGTDALILSLKAFGIGPGDEVIVPAVSFFSTAGAVSWVNAKPVFVDVELSSFNINPNLIEKAITEKTKGIIAAHLNGRMADMDEISRIAKKHNLFLIEDAAQAIGATYKGKPICYYGDIACLSFNPSKILTGFGDGGAIVTNNRPTADKISFLKMYGTAFENLSVKHPIIGVASRLSPFHAAVMNIKIENLDDIIKRQRNNYFQYSRFLDGVGDLILPSVSQDYSVNGYRYVILTKKRNELHKFLRDNKVDSRIQYGVPLPYFEAFAYLGYSKGEFPVAEKIAEESLVLPTGPHIAGKDIRMISILIKNFYEK
ncbi:MAG: DegT/DnrJ/EryC1/StrS family aminotransferase [Candidatus Azambacteria bacterium]|nr:DegT/DnrJ/EryC1/StrS family aminotransferase [Candidatus Azambacteria bacterium]